MNNYSVSNPLILEESLQVAQEYLKDFATKPDFLTEMQRAFGNSFDVELALSLVQDWSKSDFSNLPKIEIRSRDEINGANGAFASATNTVYLSREFLKANSAENIASVLLEEIGHAIDARLNQSDSPGDEGAIFSALVRKEVLSPQQLTALKTEDDTATITLDGQALKIEQSNLVVNTILDTVNANDGKLSLREAIEQANSTANADTITFDPSLSGLGIYLTGKALDIVDSGGSLIIKGLGENQLTIDADGKSRVFNITTTNPQNLIAIEGITISGGALNFYDNQYLGGGAISNGGNLTLSNVTIRDNKITYNTPTLVGGGIYNKGNLTLNNVSVRNNRNAYSAGGIFNLGSLTALNSNIQSNISEYGGGGGIYNSGGTLTLINTTVSGNNVNTYSYGNALGGGIYTYQGTVSLINSTVSGNITHYDYGDTDGGGIYNDASFVSLTNSTISDNSQVGISNHGSLDITNSIIANNNGGDFSTVGIIRPHGVNLIEDGSYTGTNIINADPNLGPLQNNGGLTSTHALLVGSLAIDAGDNTVISPDISDLDGDGNTSEPLPFDQRGVGFPRVFNGTVDLGAFESSVANASGSLAFSAADYSVNEDGTTMAAVTVTRTGGSDGAVSVSVTPADGTATAPEDYDNTPILVSFANGVTNQTVNIPIVDDSLLEGNETVNLSLSNPTGGATIGSQNTAILTIVDNDVNHSPVAADDTATTSQNTSLTIPVATLLSNDTDEDGDTLTFSSVSDATNGSVELDEEGNVVFTPATDFLGEASFDYTIADGNNNTDTAQVIVTVNLPQPTEGDDILYGTSGNDIIDGLGGNDLIFGLAGNDSLYGGNDNDTLDGGEGDDYLNPGTGINAVIGGTGFDLLDLDYSTEINNLTINYTDPNNGTISDKSSFSEIEWVIFNSGTGNDTADLSAANYAEFRGNGGNDSVVGGAGNDYLEGGFGSDTLIGGEGNDVIEGWGGGDNLSDEGDYIDAGGGNDVVYGDAGNDSILGGAGSDHLEGVGGNDTLRGGDGDDRKIGNLGGLFGGEGDDLLYGEAGNDELWGQTGNDTVDGGEGDDTLNGNQGTDSISGGEGNDIVYGGKDDDVVFGDAKNDRLFGDLGNDSLWGGEGDDTLTGGNVSGLTPGVGEKDFLHGGMGSDRFILGDITWLTYDDNDTTTDGSNDYATIADFNPTEDIIQLQGSPSKYILEVSDSDTKLLINKPSGEPDELIAIIQGVTDLNLKADYFVFAQPVNQPPVAQNDTATTYQNTPITITVDTLLSNDTDIDGDTLTLSSVDNATNGSVELNEEGNVVFTPAADFLGEATFDYTIADGNNGTDTAQVTVTVNPVIDPPLNLIGTDGDDILTGKGGNDTIDGGKGRDAIFGGDGDDILIGDLGGDTLTGGDGNDQFVYRKFSDRTDQIIDFIPGKDLLVLTKVFSNLGYSGTNPIDDGYMQLVQSGSNTLVQIDPDGAGFATFKTLVTLQNVLLNDLNSNSFQF